jgi:hypothetical protein
MFLRRNLSETKRIALGLAYAVAFSAVTLPVLAADVPDQAPPAPPPINGQPSVGTSAAPASPASPPVVAQPIVTGNEEPFSSNGRNTLLFPLDVDSAAQGTPTEIAPTLTSRIAQALNRSHVMDASVFYRNSPIIQRAISENRLRSVLAGSTLPQQIPDTAIPLIAREYNAKTVITGSVSSYAYDKSANKVEIGLTLELNDLSTGKKRLIAVSGQSKPAQVVSAELALASEAADDAALNAAAEIAGVPLETVANPPQTAVQKPVAKSHKRSSSLLILAGIAVLIVALASSHHHSGSSDNNNGGNSGGDNGGNNGGDNGDNPPPPPTNL